MVAVPRLMFLGLLIFAWWYEGRKWGRGAFGTVNVEGTPFALDSCKKVLVTGPHSMGGDLRSGKVNVLRFVQDEQGTQLWFYPRGSSVAIPIDRRDCSAWDIKTDYASDFVTPTGGDITVTCSVGGRKIDAAASFYRCSP
jgi:hypothetical protein